MKPLPFKELRIHYIYCFRIMHMPAGVLEKLDGESLPFDHLQEGLLGPLRWNSGEGFQPYVALRPNSLTTRPPMTTERDAGAHIGGTARMCNVTIRDREDPVSQLHDCEATLTRDISITPAGLGTYCATLNFTPTPDGIPLNVCLDLLNCAETLHNGCPRKRFVLQAQRGAEARPLAAWAARDIATFKQWLHDRVNDCVPEARELTLLCTEGDGVIVRGPLLALEDQDPPDVYPIQNPYVYVEIETATKTDYTELTRRNHAKCKADCLRGALAHMLIRVGSSGLQQYELDPKYLQEHGADSGDRLFPNLYPVDYVLLSTHFRSTVLLTPPLDVDMKPALIRVIRNIQEATLDTVIIVRSKWYYLVTEHAYIDALVQDLNFTWESGRGGNERFLEVQRRLLEIRFHVGYLLENPVTNRRAASSLNELCTCMSDAFSLGNMLDTLTVKLRQTIDIYNQCLDVQISERYQREQP